MRHPKSIGGILVLALAVSLFVHFSSTRDGGTLGYHVTRFNQLLMESGRSARREPSQFRDYFRLDTLRWYLRGKPTWISEWEQEQDALLAVGYFERREVVLTNRQFGAAAWRDIAISNAFFGSNKTWVVHLDDKSPAWVRVTGTNLDEFERIIRSRDVKEGR